MSIIKVKVLKNFLLAIMIIVSFTACEDNDTIPEVNFNYYVDLNSVDYNSLKVPGNAEYLHQGGYLGIIIHCNYQGEYRAYERACPYDHEKDGAIVEIDSSGNATCPVCNSQFELFNGTVLEGPSEMPLKQYSTELDGSRLYVFN